MKDRTVPASSSRLTSEMPITWKHALVIFSVIFVVLLISYSPSLRGDFLWDDDDYVEQNETLRTIEGLGDIWFELGAVPQYYPLVHTTFWVEYHIWELWSTGYRLVNLFLHALSATLLYVLLRRLKIHGALFAALIFALHPIMVESVAWITERKNVLSLVFYLSALLVSVPLLRLGEFREESKFSRVRYAIVILLFICALLSKTVTASLPAAMLLLVYLERGKLDRRSILMTLPMFVLGIGFGLLTIYVERHFVGAKGASFDYGILTRFIIAGKAVWFYFTKLFAPIDLAFIYPRWNPESFSMFQLIYPLLALAVPAWLYLGRKKLGRGPLVAVLFFGGTLFPALGFIDVYPFQFSFVADHFQYHASLGLIVLFSAYLGYAYEQVVGNKTKMQVTVVVMCLCFLILSSITYRQNKIYTDRETLWRDTLAKNPESWMPLNNLGLEMEKQGKLPEAIRYYEKAVELKPDDGIGLYNLGVVKLQVSDTQAALELFRRSQTLEPDNVMAYLNEGVALQRLGEHRKVITVMDTAIKKFPENAELYHQLGRAQLDTGQSTKGVESLKKALELDPNHAQSLFFLALFFQEQGISATAADYYQQVLKIEPENGDALTNYANILVKTGKPLEAIPLYLRALEIRPNDADVHFNLATTYRAIGENDKAKEQFEKVLEISPNDTDARKALSDLGT